MILIYIYSNIKQLYKQSYMIANNFSHCSKATKIILFKSFVSNIYLSSIWLPNRANMRKIKVAYNNAYRILMKYKRRNSASLMFLYDNVNNLTIKLRKSYNSLHQRIRNSRNSLIVQLYYYNIICHNIHMSCALRNYLPYGINLYLDNILDFVFV